MRVFGKFGKKSGSATYDPNVANPPAEPRGFLGKAFRRLSEQMAEQKQAQALTGNPNRVDPNEIPDVNRDGLRDQRDLELLARGARGTQMRFAKGGEVKKYSRGGMAYSEGGMAENTCRGGGAALRGTKFRGCK